MRVAIIVTVIVTPHETVKYKRSTLISNVQAKWLKEDSVTFYKIVLLVVVVVRSPIGSR